QPRPGPWHPGPASRAKAPAGPPRRAGSGGPASPGGFSRSRLPDSGGSSGRRSGGRRSS
nr:hypothetical protein [Tanacetum cinerariifolium]